jgi:hypothetical protein
MRRNFRILMIPVALGLSVLGALQFWHGIQGFFGAEPVATVVNDKRLTAIENAASEFQTLAQGAAQSGQPPRQSDPKVKPLLDAVFDTSILNTAAPLPHSDIQNVNEWSLRVLNIGAVYILAGTGYTDFSKLSNVGAAEQPKLREKIDGNTVAFAPEMGRYLDAQLDVMRALIWGVTADMSANPDNFKSEKSFNAVGQLRAGLVKMLVGFVTTLPIDGLSDQWRRDRIPVLTAIAPKAAAFLLPDQRKSVHDISIQVAQEISDPAVKNGLIAFASALSSN